MTKSKKRAEVTSVIELKLVALISCCTDFLFQGAGSMTRFLLNPKSKSGSKAVARAGGSAACDTAVSSAKDTSPGIGSIGNDGTKIPIKLGNFSAVWSQKQARFNVFSGGTQVTSAKQESKAQSILHDLFAGIHKSQVQAQPPPSKGTRRPTEVPTSDSVVVVNSASGGVAPAVIPRGMNPWGCKGKPQQVVEADKVRESKKRARSCKDAKSKLGPASSWPDVSPTYNAEHT